jgi:hypothetical protein
MKKPERAQKFAGRQVADAAMPSSTPIRKLPCAEVGLLTIPEPSWIPSQEFFRRLP